MSIASRKVYFDDNERRFMQEVLDSGLRFSRSATTKKGVGGAWWYVLRVALASSLRIPDRPGNEFDRPKSYRAEPQIHQVLGLSGNEADLTNIFRVLLSAHQGEDLFEDDDQFVEVLQRHLRRGLHEMRAGWRKGNDFLDYVSNELLVESAGARGTHKFNPNEVVSVLEQHGVNASLESVDKGPRLTRLVLKLSSSGDLGRLSRALETVPFELGYGYGATTELAGGERRVGVYLPRPSSEWTQVSWNQVRKALTQSKAVLPICPGVDVNGDPFLFDLADAPHVFVAGQTGSGKSVCVHAMIKSLVTSEAQCRLVLIDPKEVEFASYNKQPDLLFGGAVVSDMADAVKLLGQIIDEMDQRQRVLSDLEVTNIAEAHKKGSDLDYIIVFVEELADLLMQSKDASGLLVRLAQKSRAMGIHLVLATQRPDAETFPGLLRSNVPGRIALTVRSGSDSRIILDEGGAEKLLGQGDMLVKLPGQESIRVHGVLTD